MKRGGGVVTLSDMDLGHGRLLGILRYLVELEMLSNVLVLSGAIPCIFVCKCVQLLAYCRLDS